MTRAYSLKFLIALLAVFLGIGLVNHIVDPYSIWGSPQIKGINTSKYLVFHERIPAFVGWSKWTHPPETILLGTSRTADGLRADHPAFQNSVTLNMALGGQPAHETLLLFKHAVKSGKLKRAVIGLDFFAFNVYWAADSASQEKRLTPGANLDLLFNSSTLSDSLTTIRQSLPSLHVVNEAHGADNLPGQSDASPPAMPMRTLFKEVEKIYVDYFHPPPYRLYAHTLPDGSGNTLDDFRELLRLAHANNIELHLLISPSHAWHWQTVADVGLWQEWEHWKRSLVAINAQESQRSGQPGYPLWDFTGYNSITSETVPTAGSANKMRWYSDSSHYNHACGDLILSRVLSQPDPEGHIPADFGILIDTGNIDEHLADIRQARARYIDTHLTDTRELTDFIKQFWNH
ncbi:MAG: hypothetical protein PHH47_05075 [Gallionella sp.]|nr:hypothetical protein [Gallionella sp.]MDD4945454.1 hypothetical protein [Gallionella sp.]MDD5611781.1 hypothetical protein [Gallionella sp.]